MDSENVRRVDQCGSYSIELIDITVPLPIVSSNCNLSQEKVRYCIRDFDLLRWFAHLVQKFASSNQCLLVPSLTILKVLLF